MLDRHRQRASVDPLQQWVTVLEWVEGLYEEKVFAIDRKIESSILGTLDLTVDSLNREAPPTSFTRTLIAIDGDSV